MSQDLVSFLHARLDEEADLARRCDGDGFGEWTVHGYTVDFCQEEPETEIVYWRHPAVDTTDELEAVGDPVRRRFGRPEERHELAHGQGPTRRSFQAWFTLPRHVHCCSQVPCSGGLWVVGLWASRHLSLW